LRFLSWHPNWRDNAGLVNGVLAVVIALAIALPWFIWMVLSHGWRPMRVLGIPPDALLADDHMSLLPRLIELAPATLSLGLFGAVQAVRSALVDEVNTHERGCECFGLFCGLGRSMDENGSRAGSVKLRRGNRDVGARPLVLVTKSSYFSLFPPRTPLSSR
jgi:hypothetical protein